jgi:hypothetical protein
LTDSGSTPNSSASTVAATISGLLPPDLLRREPESGRSLLDQSLQHPIVHLGAEPAVGTLLALVGHGRAQPAAQVLEPVRADGLGKRVSVRADAELHVGAVIIDHVDIEAGDHPVAVEPHPGLVVPVRAVWSEFIR